MEPYRKVYRPCKISSSSLVLGSLDRLKIVQFESAFGCTCMAKLMRDKSNLLTVLLSGVQSEETVEVSET